MEQTNLQISQILQPALNVQIVQNNAPIMEARIIVGGDEIPQTVFGDTMTGTGTPTDPVNVSSDILNNISDNTQAIEENASGIQDLQNMARELNRDIAEIQSVIPTTANSGNQLADQGFVNSSIQTATAYFRGDWPTWADVPTNPALYPADATENRTPITNDYMVVIADEQENGGTWRYKYTGVWAEQGKSGWIPEYQINETPLTAAQLAAINSGVTATTVADVLTMKTGKQDKLTAGSNINITDNVISAALTGYVKNTDYAGVGGVAGVIRPQAAYGVTVSPSSGVMYSNSLTLTEYQSVSTACFMSKGTLENIKDDYVKRGITANTITLTDEEKAAAQAWLGVESGSSLPDQTDNAGKFLTTDGATASWSDKPLVNNAKNITDLAIGRNATVSTSAYGTAIGYRCGVSGKHYGTACAFGMGQIANAAGATQIGVCSSYIATVSNDDPDTLKVSNRNGNFEMMDANGNVPLGRLTYVTNQIGDISTALTAILGE